VRKIMLIRHGEKHTSGSHDRGITADGHHARHELTVRGWQRAGALVCHFAPPAGAPKDSPIQAPRSIFASDATKDSPSKRAMHTVGPLADQLGIPVNHDYVEDEEDALVAAILAAPSPVLVVWHHSNLPAIAKKITGGHLECPAAWPDDRFDVTWILDCSGDHAGSWTFTKVAQCLLPGDRLDTF
jgi:phosphohistidine phosphatase SixA